MIPHILEEQPKGVTARSIYGAPTHWAHSFSEKEQYEKEHPKENDDPKLMMLDSALFITGLFAVVSALMSFFLKPTCGLRIGNTYQCRGLLVELPFTCSTTSSTATTDQILTAANAPPFWKSLLVMLATMFAWGLHPLLE